jgi:NAD(P)H-dependent flavin oxidoreductase YrpB (nitropropane dioxygenase family)
VGSCQEAVAATEAGCDLIVAQSVSAGGHVRGVIGLPALL